MTEDYNINFYKNKQSVGRSIKPTLAAFPD